MTALLVVTISAVMILSAIGVVISKNLFRAALLLALTLFCTACYYLFLNAELLAAIQVLLYTGGVIILIIFAIMLTGRLVEKKISLTSHNISVGFLFSFLVFILLSFLFSTSELVKGAGKLPQKVTEGLSKEIFLRYMLPFEVLSLLLVAAIIGAIFLARKEE